MPSTKNNNMLIIPSTKNNNMLIIPSTKNNNMLIILKDMHHTPLGSGLKNNTMYVLHDCRISHDRMLLHDI